MTVLAAADPWRWQPHPEVWLLMVSLVVLAVWAVRVLGPKVVPEGEPIVTGRQRGFFVAGMAVLWLASDWPLHDISEEYLYAVHMVQHLLLTMVVPPLFLLACPTWLARAVVGEGRANRIVHRLARPVPVGLFYVAATLLTHWSVVVNASVEVGELHYVAHLLIVSASVFVWLPVCGPFPELRLSIPGQMILLFLVSIIPTVPGAWLTWAEGSVYSAYDHGDRLWGIGVTEDQQTAGLIMKLGGTAYFWTIITFLFFKWAMRHEQAEREGTTVTEREVLTWGEVERELHRLDEAEPPPVEAPGAAGPPR